MTESLTDLRNRLRERYAIQPVRVGAPPTTTAPETAQVFPDVQRAFVVEAPERESVFITAPAETIDIQGAGATNTRISALTSTNPGFGYLKGRFVEADRPNRNSAYWSSQDLELGQHTVAGGPLNWLHEERNIIGTLLTAEFVKPPTQQAAAPDIGNHIQATAAVWKFLFSDEFAVLQQASLSKQLFYSMECVSRTVQCLDTPDRPGCGETFEYATYMRDRAHVCGHLREGSSVRRFADPIFLGGAVIVPPVRPGWPGAEASVVREASAITEKADFPTLDHNEADFMVQQLLQWAGTPR